MISVDSSEMEEETTTKIRLLSIPLPLSKEDIAMKNQLIYRVYCKKDSSSGIRGVSWWFSGHCPCGGLNSSIFKFQYFIRFIVCKSQTLHNYWWLHELSTVKFSAFFKVCFSGSRPVAIGQIPEFWFWHIQTE